jgi:plastocyanin
MSATRSREGPPRLVCRQAFFLAALVILVPGSGLAEETSPRSHSPFSLRARSSISATRIDRAAGRLVLASGDSLSVLPTVSTSEPAHRLRLAEPIRDLALMDSRCFVISRSGRLGFMDLNRKNRRPSRPLTVDPPLRGDAHLAAMDDYLVLSEDGQGIRILEANPPHAHGQLPTLQSPLEPESSIFMPHRFVALTTSNRTIYAATASGEIAVIDVRRPQEPGAVRWLSGYPGTTALAANGDLLYRLGPAGLEVLDLSHEPEVLIARDETIRGESITLAGRELHVATPGLGVSTYFNATATPQVIRVTVGNNFFSPQDVVLQVGDFMRWSNLSGFHNVFSCTEFGFGCALGPANELFTSGSAAPPPWRYSYRFSEPGFNPYKCVPHSPFMIGTVTVESPAPPPLPVAVDIRPGSCRNPLNGRSRGVLPVAIMGETDLDVTTIDPDTIRLQGVQPVRWALEDIGAPREDPGLCQDSCLQGEPDGIMDLSLKFKTAEIVAALGPAENRTCQVLQLDGNLSPAWEDRPITGSDSVLRLGLSYQETADAEASR